MIPIDIRETAHDHFSIRVQYKNLWWFKFGLLFIKIGCWLTGAQFVDEFPMSLYTKEDLENDKSLLPC